MYTYTHITVLSKRHNRILSKHLICNQINILGDRVIKIRL